jgi:hypothetical protein
LGRELGSLAFSTIALAGFFLAALPPAHAQTLWEVPKNEPTLLGEETLEATVEADSPIGEDLTDLEADFYPRLDLPTLEEEAFPPLESLPTALADPQQGTRNAKPPFINWSGADWGAFAGLVNYSSSFKGKTSWALGLEARVPVPGLPLGRWALFAEVFAAYLKRDLPFFYDHQSATWFGGILGADYTLFHGEVAYFRLQGGIEYSYFNHINSVDNGFGGVVGAQLGFFWIRNNYSTSVTLTPQFVSNGTDYFILGTVGFLINF